MRQAPANELKLWTDCMDKWGEEQAAREKAEVGHHSIMSHAMYRQLTNRETS
jgi:hypothetical protein